MAPRSKTIASCLADVGLVDVQSFAGCSSREEEFQLIKRCWRRKTLTDHPDKGGSNEAFQILQTSFELLRDLHSEKKKSKKQKGGSSSEWLFSDSLKTHGAAAKKRAKSRTKTAVNETAGEDTQTTTKSGDDNEEEEEEEDFDMSAYDFDWSKAPMPSWDFFAEAAEEEMPTYRVEKAKSGRSKCKVKNGSKAKKCAQGLFQGDDLEECTDVVETGANVEVIEKGELRAGWIQFQSGAYGGWKHLRCWRVPSKVWKGLPEPTDDAKHDFEAFSVALTRMEDTVLCGFTELQISDQRLFVEHLRDKDENWAREVNRKAPVPMLPAPPVPQALQGMKQGRDSSQKSSTEATSVDPVASSDALVKQSTAVVESKRVFVIPKPGENGASSETALQGTTFVLTGTFPEIGGGGGLDLGKAKARAMIEAFGGRVTGSVSGKTNVLLVGKDPGMSKVNKARRQPSKTVLASIRDIKEGLDAGLESFEEFDIYKSHHGGETMKIESFSAGYHTNRGGYNGLALTASKKEMLIAQGLLDPTEKIESAKPTSSVLSIENGNKKPAAIENGKENVASNEEEAEEPSKKPKKKAAPKKAAVPKKKAVPKKAAAAPKKKAATKKAAPPKKKQAAKKKRPVALITDGSASSEKPAPKKRMTRTALKAAAAAAELQALD